MCLSYRSRQEVSNEDLLEKMGVDTAENEPSNFQISFPPSQFNFRDLISYPYHTDARHLFRVHRTQMHCVLVMMRLLKRLLSR